MRHAGYNIRPSIYCYTATDKNGNLFSEKIKAKNMVLAKAILRNKNINFIKIEKQKLLKLKSNHICDLFRNLARMLGAGISIIDSLEVVKKENIDNKLKTKINYIIGELKYGLGFYSTINNNFIIKNFYINLIKIGEESGKLVETLHYIASYEDKMRNLTKKIINSLYYPTIVLIATLASLLFIFLYIIPEFILVYNEFNLTLPVATKILLNITNIINKYGAIIILTTIIAFLFARMKYIQKDKTYTIIQNLLLKMPLIGPILTKMIIFKVFYALSISLKSGIALTNAIELAIDLTNHNQYKSVLIDIKNDIFSGNSLSKALLIKTDYFPEKISYVIRISEEIGNLDEILFEIATIFEEETTCFFDKCTKFIEPILILFFGLIIGCIVISTYLPLINLGSII